MGEHAKKVLRDALALSPDERAELAAELMASLDGDPDADVDAAWSAELEARARRAIAGETAGTDWADVRSRIEDRLRRR
jgi:putative addiction module component (TIGR02574 family)